MFQFDSITIFLQYLKTINICILWCIYYDKLRILMAEILTYNTMLTLLKMYSITTLCSTFHWVKILILWACVQFLVESKWECGQHHGLKLNTEKINSYITLYIKLYKWL